MQTHSFCFFEAYTRSILYYTWYIYRYIFKKNNFGKKIQYGGQDDCQKASFSGNFIFFLQSGTLKWHFECCFVQFFFKTTKKLLITYLNFQFQNFENWGHLKRPFLYWATIFPCMKNGFFFWKARLSKSWFFSILVLLAK